MSLLTKERIENAMPNLRDTAIRLYRHLFGDAIEGGTIADGTELFLDGNSAVAVCEAAISNCAALGGSFAAGTSEAIWRHEHQRTEHNLFNESLSFLSNESPRSAVAAAMGLASTGRRTTVFISGNEAVQCIDLITQATAKHLPLVIHVHDQAIAAHGTTLGSSHESVHLIAQTGAITLFSQNVQEAVDLTLIARVIAENSLTPVILFMDEQSTTGAQAVSFPSVEMVQQFVGFKSDSIESITPAQEMVFGQQRQRVPVWHDLDRPVLHGVLLSNQEYAYGKAANDLYFSEGVIDIVHTAFSTFKKLSGRDYQPFSVHGLDKADKIILAQGAVVEQLFNLANQMREQRKLRVGVIGLRLLRPFNDKALQSLLSTAKYITVLERGARPLAGSSPLYQEVAMVAGSTRLSSVIYGIGGLPLASDDLAAYLQSTPAISTKAQYLGLHWGNEQKAHPKRQVLYDTLKRDYPLVQHRAVPLANKALKSNRFSINILHSGTHLQTRLLNDVSSVLHRITTETVRTQPGRVWESWGNTICDQIRVAKDRYSAASEENKANLTVVLSPEHHQSMDALNGTDLMLVIDQQTTIDNYQQSLLSRINQLQNIYMVDVSGLNHSLRHEKIVGAICQLFEINKSTGTKIRRLIEFRKEHMLHWGEIHSNEAAEQLQSGFESVQKLDISNLHKSPATPWDGSVPMAIRHLVHNNERYDSLPRFWDQVGVLYREGEPELSPDPYLATGTLPPLSATLRDHSQFNQWLPQFNENGCSGCGLCWSRCPDSAIGASALTIKEIIAGVITATSADALRPLATKLATAMTKVIKVHPEPTQSLDQLVNAAFEQIQQKSPLTGDRLENVVAALNQIISRFGVLKLYKTSQLYDGAESRTKDSGILLSLVVNSDGCKGCGICADSCAENVISMSAIQQTPEIISHSKEDWKAWEQLPDSSSTSIEQIAKAAIDPVAAQMLSRHCAFTLASGDGAEAGSGEKIALRMALTTIEYRQQPLFHQWSESIADQLSEITQSIRATLSEALPTDDLEAMAYQLSQIKSRRIDIIKLIPGDKDRLDSAGVDAAQLRELIEIAQGLGDLQRHLQSGESGLGRARYSLAISPGIHSSWAGTFPYNPFQVPTLINTTGDLIATAMGMIQGEIENLGLSLALVRKATNALKNSGSSKQKASASQISWDEMNAEEKRLISPLVVVANSRELAGTNMAQLSWLLKSNLPVKVLVMNDHGLGLDNETTAINMSGSKNLGESLVLQSLFGGDAYIAQTSIATAEHLHQCMNEALNYHGPALIDIYTPSPLTHGHTTTQVLELAQQAIDTRVAPLLRYNPESDGLFGKRLILEGNPQIKSTWVLDEEQQPQLPTQWMLNQGRFDHCFTAITANTSFPTPLIDYLETDGNSKVNKTPIIKVLADNVEVTSIAVKTEVTEAVAAVAQRWQILQELAGEVTPFTQKVRAEVLDEVKASHQNELAALVKKYEQKIAAIHANHNQITAQKIRSQLMSLAGYDPTLLDDKTVQ